MNLRKMTLSKGSQTLTGTHYVVPCNGGDQNRQIRAQEADRWLSEAGGKGPLRGYSVSLWGEEKVLELERGDGGTGLHHTLESG